MFKWTKWHHHSTRHPTLRQPLRAKLLAARYRRSSWPSHARNDWCGSLGCSDSALKPQLNAKRAVIDVQQKFVYNIFKKCRAQILGANDTSIHRSSSGAACGPPWCTVPSLSSPQVRFQWQQQPSIPWRWWVLHPKCSMENWGKSRKIASKDATLGSDLRRLEIPFWTLHHLGRSRDATDNIIL